MSQIAELRRSITKKREELRAEIKKNLLNVFSAFFESNPLIKTIYFSAFTPYWNDGETCEFSVHSDVMFTTAEWQEVTGPHWHNQDPEDTEEAKDALRDFRRVPSEENRARYEAAIKASDHKTFEVSEYSGRYRTSEEGITDEMMEIAKLIMDDEFADDLKAIVGDHVFVRIHRGGIETEEYDHE